MQVVHATYLAKTFSDHNLLEIAINCGRIPTPVPTWRLWPQLLEDSAFRATMSDPINHYFAENSNSASNRLVEWDVFKTVIRGKAISTTVGARQEVRMSLIDIEHKMDRLEQEAASDADKQAPLQEARIRHAEILESLCVIDHQKYTQLRHTEADKSGILLAKLLRDNPSTIIIN